MKIELPEDKSDHLYVEYAGRGIDHKPRGQRSSKERK